MIRNNLAVLLAQRKIKATRVAVDTGIARSTLSSLTNNESKMIQFDTINNLCAYLKIEPKDFFDFSPIDFEINFVINSLDAYFYIDDSLIEWHQGIKNFSADLFLKVYKNKRQIDTIEMTAELSEPAENSGFEEHDNGDTVVRIKLLDPENKLNTIWKNENLYSFWSSMRNDLLNNITAPLIESANGQVEDDTLFSNWSIDLEIPVDPF